ncbi:hypothetical protein R6Q57_030108 [Mikania cordata]
MEHISELFRLNPDEVVIDYTSAPVVDEPSPDIFDDIGEVILEDFTKEDSQKYTSAEGELPTFIDLFGQATEEELSRHVEENVSGGESSADDIQQRKEEWKAYWETLKKENTVKIPAIHTKLYRTKGCKAGARPKCPWLHEKTLGPMATRPKEPHSVGLSPSHIRPKPIWAKYFGWLSSTRQPSFSLSLIRTSLFWPCPYRSAIRHSTLVQFPIATLGQPFVRMG